MLGTEKEAYPLFPRNAMESEYSILGTRQPLAYKRTRIAERVKKKFGKRSNNRSRNRFRTLLVHQNAPTFPWLSMTILTKIHGLEKLETTNWAEQGLRQTRGVSWDPVSELKCAAKLLKINVTSIVDTIFAIVFTFNGGPKTLCEQRKLRWHYSLIQMKSNFPWLSMTDTNFPDFPDLDFEILIFCDFPSFPWPVRIL